MLVTESQAQIFTLQLCSVSSLAVNCKNLKFRLFLHWDTCPFMNRKFLSNPEKLLRRQQTLQCLCLLNVVAEWMHSICLFHSVCICWYHDLFVLLQPAFQAETQKLWGASGSWFVCCCCNRLHGQRWNRKIRSVGCWHWRQCCEGTNYSVSTVIFLWELVNDWEQHPDSMSRHLCPRSGCESIYSDSQGWIVMKYIYFITFLQYFYL